MTSVCKTFASVVELALYDLFEEITKQLTEVSKLNFVIF